MISNDAYNKEWDNPDNRRIMKAASKRYRGMIPEDEMQSCHMIALWKSLTKFDPNRGCKFSSFLYRSVIYQCRSWMRSYNRHKDEMQLKFPFLIIEDTESHIEDVDIADSIDDLSPDLKSIIHDRYILGKTIAEIAKNKDCGYETVRRKIEKALCQMRRDMA